MPFVEEVTFFGAPQNLDIILFLQDNFKNE